MSHRDARYRSEVISLGALSHHLQHSPASKVKNGHKGYPWETQKSKMSTRGSKKANGVYKEL